MKLRYKLAWNAVLLSACGGVAVGLIQHAVFFYSFPPDFSIWLDITPMAYLCLAGFLYASLKVLHILEEKGELIGNGE